MAVRDFALSTLTNAKLALGISASDTSKDTYIEACIDRATLLIEDLTQRKLKARNYNGFNASGEGSDFEHKTTGTGDTVASEDFLHFDGNNCTRDENGYIVYYLPQYPILKVSGTNQNRIHHPNAVTFRLDEIVSRGSQVSGYETWDALTEYDDYILNQETGAIRLLGGAFAAGQKNYRVKCTAGFSLKPANTQPYVPPDLEALCIEMTKSLFRENSNLQSESIGTWSRTYNHSVENPFVKSTLAAYSKISL